MRTARTCIRPAANLGPQRGAARSKSWTTLLHWPEPQRKVALAKTLQPFGIEAVNPIAQNLPIHPAGSGSLPARFALQNQRQGQHATDYIGVISPLPSPRSSAAV
jgi:hypothetical protein